MLEQEDEAMNKKEFLEELQKNLAGEVPRKEIESNIAYYNNYISSQGAANGSEEAVIKEIGEPRLIARTIIETYKMSHIGSIPKHKQDEAYEEYNEGYEEGYQDPLGQSIKVEFGTGKIPFKYKAIGIGVLVFLLFFLFLLGKALFFIFFKFLLPILVIWGILGLIMRVFK